MDTEVFKNVIATTASVSTILQFLTGTLVCLTVVQNKSTGDISSFPFVSGFLSTGLWLRYGFFLGDDSIILVNTIGVSLFFSYTVIFYIYSIKKSAVVRQFIGSSVFLMCILLYLRHAQDLGEAKKSLGIVCCLVTVLFFAAPLASFLHVVRVKNTDSLPFPIIFASFVVSIQWLMYGFILGDTFIQVPNLLGCILSGFQLALFCVYPRTFKKGYSTELI